LRLGLVLVDWASDCLIVPLVVLGSVPEMVNVILRPNSVLVIKGSLGKIAASRLWPCLKI